MKTKVKPNSTGKMSSEGEQRVACPDAPLEQLGSDSRIGCGERLVVSAGQEFLHGGEGVIERDQ